MIVALYVIHTHTHDSLPVNVVIISVLFYKLQDGNKLSRNVYTAVLNTQFSRLQYSSTGIVTQHIFQLSILFPRRPKVGLLSDLPGQKISCFYVGYTVL